MCHCIVEKAKDFKHLKKKDGKKNLQHIFSEAPFPFSLVEKVVEMAAEGDENKAKSKESKYA